MNKPTIYKICGTIGMFGVIAVVASNIIGIALHEKHDPISDTISMLAIGKYGWIQDVGLDILAVGFLAVAVGLYTWKHSGIKWIISLIFTVLIGIDLVMIAEHNQYAGRRGNNIHTTLVYTLAGLSFMVSLLSSFDLKSLQPYLKNVSLWIAALILIFFPIFTFVPDSWDGAYERFISAIFLAWPAVMSYQLLKLSRRNS